MEEKFEYQGYWWSPEEPQEKLPGTLKFDPEEGTTLSLFGSLKAPAGDAEGVPILGLSTDHTPITLTGLVRPPLIPGLPSGTRRSGTSTTIAGTVIVGEHFEREEDVGFDRLIVDYLHLNAWAGNSGFEIEMIDDPETYPVTVRHEIPEPMTARVGDEYEVTLFFGGNRTWSARPVTEVTITQPAELVVRFPEKRPLGDLMDIAYRLQHFLSLGMRRSSYPVAVWGANGPVGEASRVEIHYRPLGRIDDVKRPESFKMLFALRDLPQGFETAAAKWLKRAEVLDPVYRLYLTTLYDPDMFLEQRFLNLAHALEVYHRRAMSTPDLPEEEHEKRKEAILEAVSDQHRDWLEGKLKYSNEPNLRKRIKEIFKEYPESVKATVGSSGKERDSFINKVVRTRNYRTHFDESLAEQAARGEDLHRINEKLKLLMEVCLLSEIGFEDEDIGKAVLGLR
jgi:hypothetical protein